MNKKGNKTIRIFSSIEALNIADDNYARSTDATTRFANAHKLIRAVYAEQLAKNIKSKKITIIKRG